jgi:hypothetical protein
MSVFIVLHEIIVRFAIGRFDGSNEFLEVILGVITVTFVMACRKHNMWLGLPLLIFGFGMGEHNFGVVGIQTQHLSLL